MGEDDKRVIKFSWPKCNNYIYMEQQFIVNEDVVSMVLVEVKVA